MSSSTVIPSPSTFIVDAVQRIACEHPGAIDLTQQIFLALDKLPEVPQPRPIATAPHDEGRRLFLYCPLEGWVAGSWYNGGWIAALTLAHELRPTWWMDVPESPGPRATSR